MPSMLTILIAFDLAQETIPPVHIAVTVLPSPTFSFIALNLASFTFDVA